MKQEKRKVYGYRWIVLLAFMLATAVNQLLWITFAPITGDAASFYGVDELSIGLLSMSFMIVYIVVSIPASWLIDTYGFRLAVGIGAVLTGVFGLTRGLLATSYTWVLISQIGIAIGQPLILNAVTRVASRWFPLHERATASGLGSLAMYLGIFAGLTLTPYLAARSSIATLLLAYGIVAVVAAVVFWVLAREHPPTPASPPEQEERSLAFDGLRQALRNRGFLLLLALFFIGLGVFNSVTTWIEEIVGPRGFSSTQAGLTGGLMVAGGVVGALILPTLSDRARRRVPFIIIGLAGAALGLVGITFAAGYPLLLAAAFVLGFFLLSTGPICFQYGAEITYPAPEGMSTGLLLLMGQISGILFILGMDTFKNPTTGAMTWPLLVLIGLTVVALLLAFGLRESPLLAGATSDGA